MGISQYTKNVAKSLGYLTDSFMRDTVIGSTVEENKDTVKDMYQNIKEFTKSPKQYMSNNTMLCGYAPILKEGFDNLIDDIKTGTFYNKSREDSVFMKQMGFDDLDFNLDDMDFGFDDDEDSKKESIKDSIEDKIDTVADINNIKAMDVIGRTTAKAISMSTAKSAEYIVQSQVNATKSILSQQYKMFNQVSTGLIGINRTLSTITKIAEPLNAHMKNAVTFYTDTTKKLDTIISKLDSIDKSLTPTEYKDHNSEYIGIDAYMGSNGNFSINNIKNMLGKNFKNAIDSSMLGMITGASITGDPKDMLKTIMSNPLGNLISGIISFTITENLQNAINGFEDTVKGFNSILIKRLKGLEKSNNPIKSFIGKLFDYDDSLKSSIDTSSYNKGKVDFDGKTRLAIINVIPTYLSKILAAITHGNETRFDYNDGKFTNIKKLQEKKEKMAIDRANIIGQDFLNDINDTNTLKDMGIKPHEIYKYENVLNKYFLNAFKKNVLINPSTTKPSDYAKYGLQNEAQMKMVLKLYNYYIRTGNYSAIMQLDKKLNSERMDYNNEFSRNKDTFSNLYDNSIGKDANEIFGNQRVIGSNIYDINNTKYTSGIELAARNNAKLSNSNNIKLTNEQFESMLSNISNLSNIKKAMLKRDYKRIFSNGNNLERQDFINKLKSMSLYEAEIGTGINNHISTRDRFNRYKNNNEEDIDDEENEVKRTFNDYINDIKKIYTAPMEFMSRVLKKADRTLFEIIYGRIDGEGNLIGGDNNTRSIVGLIFSNITDLFSNFKTFIIDNIFIPLKDVLKDTILSPITLYKKIKDKIDEAGGIKELFSNITGMVNLDDTFNAIGGHIKDTSSNVGEDIKSVLSFGKNAVKNQVVNPIKSNINNSFKNNKNSNDDSNEGSGSGLIYANKYYGGASHFNIDKFSDTKVEKIYKEYKSGISIENLAKKYNVDIIEIKRVIDRYESKGPVDWSTKKIINLKDEDAPIHQILDETKNAIDSTIKALFPENERGIDSTKSKVKNIVITGLSEILDSNSNKKKISGMITGSLFGLGGSILSGGLISPILGASLGAATGLVLRSNKLQDLLFGPNEEYTDENGNIKTRRSGGIFSNRITEFLTQKLPKSLGFSIGGGLLGLLPIMPGGPVGGVILGSAIGFARQSKDVQEFLFGVGDKGIGLLGSKEDHKKRIDWIKKILPRAGAGALLGAIGGPFGFMTNIILGAGLGLVSDTQKFKDIVFGKEIVNSDGTTERQGGIMGYIRKDIINPVANAIQPITKELQHSMKNLFRMLFKGITKVVKSYLVMPIAKRILKVLAFNRLTRFVSKSIRSVIGKTIALPFKTIGAIGNRFRRKQIRKGYADYMTAKERLDYRIANNMGRDRFTNADEAMAQMDNANLESAINKIKDIRNNSELRSNSNSIVNNKNDIFRLIDNRLSASQAAKLKRYFKKTGNNSIDRDELLNLLTSNNIEGFGLNLSDEDKSKIINSIDNINKSSNSYYAKDEDTRNKIQDITKAFNLNKLSDLDAMNLQELLSKELHDRKINKGNNIVSNMISNDTITKECGKIRYVLKKIYNLFASKSGKDKLDLNNDDYGNNIIDTSNDSNINEEDNTSEDNTNISGSGSLIKKHIKYITSKKYYGGDSNNNEVFDNITGDYISMNKTSTGDMIEDVADKGNRLIKKKRNNIFGTFIGIRSYIKSTVNILNHIKDALVGNNKENKPSLLSNLFEGTKKLLFGENGFLGGIMKFFTGVTSGEGLVGALLGKFNIKQFLPEIGILLGLKGFKDLISGKFDNFLSKHGWGKEDNKGGLHITTKDGQVAHYATTNEVLSSNGKLHDGDITVDGKTKYIGEVNATTAGGELGSTMGIKSLARGIAGGTGSYWLAKKGINFLAKRNISKFNTFVSKHSEQINKIGNAVSPYIAKLSGLIGSLFNKLIRLKVFDPLRPYVSQLSKNIASKVGNYVKNFANLAKKALVILRIAFAVVDFMDGYQDCASILGIVVGDEVEQPSFLMRLMTGIINLLLKQIPIIDLIPLNVLVDMIGGVIAPVLGISAKDLKARRAKSDKVVEQYNREHNTDYTVREYNKNVKHDYTTIEKIKNVWSTSKANSTTNISPIHENNNINRVQSKGTGRNRTITYNHGRRSPSSGGSSFISQLDPRYANTKFGTSTIGNKGCAPAVAAMLTGNKGLYNTAQYAIDGGYTNNKGTSADYFGDVLSSKGISSEYVYTGAGSATDYIESKIASGYPTILLGQDKYNTSKANSPFGPGNHYVLATGKDRNGDIIIQDPEANRPNIVYDRSIMNNVKLGIPTGGSSNIRKKFKVFRGGKAIESSNTNISSTSIANNINSSNNMTQNQREIWTFLKSKGFSDAGAAGIMGCWQAESGNRPDRLEGDYLHLMPVDQATASSEALDHYTVDLLFPKYNIKINKNGYKASNGHYYPGFGLAQWTGNRGANLFNYAKSKNADWRKLRTQLDFAFEEFSTRYRNTYNKLKEINDVAEATKIAYREYEGGKRNDWLQKRIGYATMIYNACSGKTYTLPTDIGMSSNVEYNNIGTHNNIANSNNNAFTNVMEFGSIFTKLASVAFGNMGKLVGLGGDDEDNNIDIANTNDTTNTANTTGNTNVYDGSLAKDASGYNTNPAIAKLQRLLVNTMDSVRGKLAYSQSGPRDPDKGSADCSSTINWAYKKVLNNSIGSNTGSMLNSSKMVTVDKASNLNYNGFNNKTSGPNESKLQPGDIVLYSRKGNYAKGRPYNVGHVSMYVGNDKVLSHGSGIGPKIQSLSKKGGDFGANTYIEARRYSGFTNGEYSDQDNDKYKRQGMVAMGSGLYNIAQDGYNTINRKHDRANIVNLSNYTDTRKAMYYSHMLSNIAGGNSGLNNDTMIALIKGIISLLTNVSANSDHIKEAVNVLNQILANTGNNNSSNITANNTPDVLGSGDMDNAIKEMQQLLNNLASGM